MTGKSLSIIKETIQTQDQPDKGTFWENLVRGGPGDFEPFPKCEVIHDLDHNQYHLDLHQMPPAQDSARRSIPPRTGQQHRLQRPAGLRTP